MGMTYCISLDFCQSQGHQQFSIVVTQLQAVFWTGSYRQCFGQSQGHQQFSIVVTQLQAVFWTVTCYNPATTLQHRCLYQPFLCAHEVL